jgi:predicted protein tyrosine phosphatase
MERWLRGVLRRRFGADAVKEIVCLNIPDDFQYMQPELVTLMTERLTPFLGPPSRVDCGGR